MKLSDIKLMRISERHLKTVLDHASDGVLVECEEKIEYVNMAYARMLGYPSATEIVGATIRDIADPEDFERLTWFGRCRLEGKPAPTRYNFRARGRSGNTVLFDACISTARTEGNTLITTIVREVVALREDAVPKLEMPGLTRLSARELEIVEHLLDGMRSKEIALLLDISEKTICTHRSRAFRKLGLRSDRELFRLAAELGLLERRPAAAEQRDAR
jgi:PAS domain S-box-containing protein